MSGYTDCACRDCFDVAISSDARLGMCLLCKQAGCDTGGECQRDDAYGVTDVCEACGDGNGWILNDGVTLDTATADDVHACPKCNPSGGK